MAVVRASLAMLPRLQAEEALLAVTTTTLAVGRLEKDAATKLLDHLHRVAGIETAAPVVKRPSDRALRGAGIGVRRAPKGRPPDGV